MKDKYQLTIREWILYGLMLLIVVAFLTFMVLLSDNWQPFDETTDHIVEIN